ncbi:putative HTH-type transcriptional regulator YdgG [Jeotgalicoccus coquinae]|uniref:DNA-binding MarR family transcriptional regulator n=1 Tax=Jeotgalicoccus coquinae TaxID=709509 RepID=A0A6V7RQX5_9STAP|nr:MarR family transcriptional regulator [Jeotgalicoccus coquinae]MBB6424006.1 DNA-binding MarR family transcriptional regulator [Jeotgalicoccus coquinae]GGE23232.1 putative HTH-type transcriptional regulator YdgG [Jeotgalicoccus coquinae]CAD2080108.1 MarR family protein [Jeotgalicoccus coquinae]
MPAKDESIHNLAHIFAYGYAHVFSEVTESVRKMHISKEQMAIIEYLHIYKEATPTELAAELNVHKSSIAHALRKLGLKKLVTSRINKLTNDKRSKLISLTPAAAELVDDFISNIHNVIGTHVRELSAEDSKALLEATRTIIKTINIDGGLPNETRA